MASIRVNTGLKVEVNDAGEYITIPIEDSDFLARFHGVVDVADKISDEVAGMDMTSEEKAKDNIAFIKEKSKELMKATDELFGAETCRKVFGDIVPSGYAFADFFSQLLPVIEEYRNERETTLSSRYSKKRKGGR